MSALATHIQEEIVMCLVDQSCVDCKHYYIQSWDRSARKYACCIYILNTGHPRPCPAGKECTVREIRKRRKRPKGMSIKY